MNTISIPNELLLGETAELIANGHTVTHLVRGNSMNPFLVDRRDKVIIGPFTDNDLKQGAVVLAKDTNGRYVLHRIISRQENKIILMGDGNLVGTEETSPDMVTGLVLKMVRKEKLYDCKGKIWKWYSAIWVRLKPVRRYLLGIWRRI